MWWFHCGLIPKNNSISSLNLITSVLNIDQCVGKRNLSKYDSDLLTIVCFNDANIYTCKSHRIYVGDIQHMCSHKVVILVATTLPNLNLGQLNEFGQISWGPT